MKKRVCILLSPGFGFGFRSFGGLAWAHAKNSPTRRDSAGGVRHQRSRAQASFKNIDAQGQGGFPRREARWSYTSRSSGDKLAGEGQLIDSPAVGPGQNGG